MPAGEGTRVIAAWDVVPWRAFGEPFRAGVVAFHESGVKVQFKVTPADGAAVLLSREVLQPALNERTNVWEFWLELDPAELPTGLIHVQARAVPLGAEHLAVDLPPLPLHVLSRTKVLENIALWVDCANGDDADGDGTKPRPFKTLAVAVRKSSDGATIHLQPGRCYSAQALGGGRNRARWTIITAAPGAEREQVEIGPGRTGTEKLCFRNVTLFADPPDRRYNTILAGENGATIVWLDNCKLYNRKGRWGGGGNAFGNRYVGYVTGGITTDMDNGPGAVLLRNHEIVRIASDALTNARTAINCRVRDIDPGTTGAHPDFHQSYVGDRTKVKTAILYNCSGVDCIAQGFFGHNLKDSAFVNCLFHKGETVMLSQYSGKLDHVLWLHLTVPNQGWLWRGAGLDARNCHVLNCIFAGMSRHQGADAGGLTMDCNHYMDPKRAMGTGTTTGDPHFVDADRRDFRLRVASPAADGGRPLQCVPADIEGKPYGQGGRPRGCYSPAAGGTRG
jgi:hypothetical protein